MPTNELDGFSKSHFRHRGRCPSVETEPNELGQLAAPTNREFTQPLLPSFPSVKLIRQTLNVLAHVSLLKNLGKPHKENSKIQEALQEKREFDDPDSS